MDLVVDTSVLPAVALDEPEKASPVGLTQGAARVAPEILPHEIGNALSAPCRRGGLSPDEARKARRIRGGIPVQLIPADIERSLELAATHRIHAYDAFFLQCALRPGSPLLTVDRRMARIARSEGVAPPR